MAGETLKIGNTDLSATAYITSWEGILAVPPTRGEVIELDFVDGGVWQAGAVSPWTVDVPLVMKSQDTATAVGQMRAIQSFADGTQKTITRVYTSGVTQITETAQGVVTSATPVWDLGVRSKVGLLLVIQMLTEWA